jgi:lysozyme family protein
MSRFETCLGFVLKEEGGFVDHPQDPGGATNHGITKDTWEAWAKKPATVADIRNLTVADVVPIYRDRYWEAAKCPRLPLGVDLAVFDFAVNSGPATAIRHLQKVADTEVSIPILAISESLPHIPQRMDGANCASPQSVSSF